ncbi:MAG: hypothetical protein WCE75_09935 [Terracidiphilus sp.]
MTNQNSLSLPAVLGILLLFSLPSHAQAPVPSAAPEPARQPSPAAPAMPRLTLDSSGAGLALAGADESFTELTLKGSNLKPDPPVMGSREVTENFTRELWQVNWRPNDPIDLWVILPKGVKNPPVVLYLYGFPTDTARFRDLSYCRRITGSGAAAVGFVSAYTGHRSEHGPMNHNFVTRMPEAMVSTVHDIQLILDFLQSRGDLDMSRVGIFGQGSGGAIATLAASVEPRIKALDLLVPWFDYPVWFRSAVDVPWQKGAPATGLITPEILEALEPFDPLVVLPRLKTQKIRLQIAGDQGMPAEALDQLQAAMPAPGQLARFQHEVNMYDLATGGRIFQWLATQLDAHPAPPEPAPAAPPKTTP